MCDQTNPYKPGDRVWTHLYNRVWWPGTVVDPLDTPQELQEFITRKKAIVVVQFPTDKKYENFSNLNKIFLYNCPRKNEFLKKGYLLYQKQIKKNVKAIFDYNMENFLEDVIRFENETGGDPNIFEQFEPEEKIVPTVNIKELFTTEKSRRKMKKSLVEKGRQSLPASKTLPALPINKKLSTPKAKLKQVAAKLPSRGVVSREFACYFDLETKCTYVTQRFEHLKRHMAEHKAEADRMKKNATNSSTSNANTEFSSASSSKRYNVRPKKTYTKKIKLHDELLKEWDLDEAEDADKIASENRDTNTVKDKSNDEDKKSLDTNTNDVEKTSVEKTSVEKTSVENEKIDLDKNINQDENVVGDISQDTIVVQDKNVGEDKTTMIKSKNSTIFDFEEDDTSNLIPDLRPSKSDNNSTAEDDITESFNAKCDQELITSTIFESTQSQLPVEESDEDKGLANDIESSKLFLKKSVNTLDQIINLEESMNNISSSGNKLIEDDQSDEIIESLNEITYLDKDINNHLDVVAGTSIQTENEAMVKTNVNADDFLVTSPAEMQQLIDNKESSTTSIVIDDENEKLCSNVDSTQIQNINTEEVVDPTDNGRYESLLDEFPIDWMKKECHLFPPNCFKEVVKLPTCNESNLPEFLKETPRAVEQDICPGSGVVGAMPSSKINSETEQSDDHSQPDSSSFWISLEFFTIDVEKQLEVFNMELFTPKIIDIPFEPTVTHKVQEHVLTPANRKRYKVIIPKNSNVKGLTKEELLALPEVQRDLELQKTKPGPIRLELPEGSLMVPYENDQEPTQKN